jgi:hypothetical protein
MERKLTSLQLAEPKPEDDKQSAERKDAASKTVAISASLDHDS